MRHSWTLEAEMCGAAMRYLSEPVNAVAPGRRFVDSACNAWDVYPEMHDADIFAVARRPNPVSGVRVGDRMLIEAKLRASMEVLAQSLSPKQRLYRTASPAAHWRVVLVPTASAVFRRLCTALGVVLWCCGGDPIRCGPGLSPEYKGMNPSLFSRSGWVKDTNRKEGRFKVWAYNDGYPYQNPPPNIRWPEVVEAIERKEGLE